MKQIKDLSNYVFEVGQIYYFNYQGGSNPGAKRLVLITENLASAYYISGIDGQLGEFRSFSESKIINCYKLESQDYRVVNQDDLAHLPTAYQDLAQLAKDYIDDGFDIILLHNKVLYVIEKDLNKESIEVDIDVYGTYASIIVIRNEKTIKLYLRKDGKVDINQSPVDNIKDNVSASQIIEAFAKLV